MTSDSLTEIDLRILKQMQKDSSLSSGELAERVGLSQSPCWRRLQRMKDEGYIEKQVALLDRGKFPHTTVIFATLKISTLTDSERADFYRKVELREEIVECYTLFGERDVMIKVLATSMEWYQNFIFNVLMKLPGVVDIQSTVTLSEVKYTTAIPLQGT